MFASTVNLPHWLRLWSLQWNRMRLRVRQLPGRFNAPRWWKVAAERRAGAVGRAAPIAAAAADTDHAEPRSRRRGISQESVWKFATLTGTLGLLLLLLLQWAGAMSLPRRADGDPHADGSANSNMNDAALVGSPELSGSEPAESSSDPFGGDRTATIFDEVDRQPERNDDGTSLVNQPAEPMPETETPTVEVDHGWPNDVPNSRAAGAARSPGREPVPIDGNEDRPLVELDIFPAPTPTLVDDSQALTQQNEYFLVGGEPPHPIGPQETGPGDTTSAADPTGWHPFRPTRVEHLSEPVLQQRGRSAGQPSLLLASFEPSQPVISLAGAATKDLKVAVTRQAPREVAAGNVFQYELVVRNESSTAVDAVGIEERLPAAYRLHDVSPAAEFGMQKLRWRLGRLEPGEERRLNVWLSASRPESSEHRARVEAAVAVAAETLIEGPELQLKVTRTPSVRLGSDCRVRYELINAGAIAADNVKLFVDLPPQLSHPKGRALKLELGALESGARRVAHLTARTTAAGSASSRCQVVADETVLHTAQTDVVILPPTASANTAAAANQGSSPPYRRCVPRRIW